MRALLVVLALLFESGTGVLADEMPRRGGTLTYMIPADAPPSLDGHREGTYATIHAVAPFYSVLMRVDPANPSDTTRFVCDLCLDVPTPTDDGKTFTFRIREGVKFQDGAMLTAADVSASWNAIIFPPKGVLSARQNWYSMVDKVESPDATTVIFHLKFATSVFLPALADPYAFIYEKKILDTDPHWYETHVMGSGPFHFVNYTIGQSRSRVCATLTIYHSPASPTSTWVQGSVRAETIGAGGRDPRRPRGDRVPRPAALGTR